MTITEAISKTDAKKRNVISEDEKVEWLSELDSRVFVELYETHENAPITEIPKYDSTTERERDLIIPHPYEALYPLWLEAKIDYAVGDTARYLNSYAMFNSLYTEFARWYHRKNKPKGVKLKFF